MVQPARERLLEAAARLIRERGMTRVTTREIAEAAGTAEGGFFKTSVTRWGCSRRCSARNCRRTGPGARRPPQPGPGDPETVLGGLMERAIDFYSASLPLLAGSVADSDLLRRQQQVNREAGTGPQLAIDAMDEVFRSWQKSRGSSPRTPTRTASRSCSAAALSCKPTSSTSPGQADCAAHATSGPQLSPAHSPGRPPRQHNDPAMTTPCGGPGRHTAGDAPTAASRCHGQGGWLSCGLFVYTWISPPRTRRRRNSRRRQVGGRGQHRIECLGELPGPVPDQEPEPTGALPQVHQQVPGLLHRPRPSRCAVTPRTCTWRVPTSSTENTCSRRKVTAQSTWKKSHASLVEAWVRRNCRHVDRARSGAGGMRSRWRERQQDPWKLGVPTTVLPVVKWQGGGGGHSRGSGDIGGVPVALELHRDLMTRDVGAGHVTGTRRRSRAPRRRRFWRAGR